MSTITPVSNETVQRGIADLHALLREPVGVAAHDHPLERLNGERRRRTKTQGSFRGETSALAPLFGLVALGVVRLRKIDGWKQMTRASKNS